MLIQNGLSEALVVERGVRSKRHRHQRLENESVLEGFAHHPESLVRGAIQELSLSGCLITTKGLVYPKLGSEVELRFSVGDAHYRTFALVVRIEADGGIGLEFAHENRATSERFQTLINSLPQEDRLEMANPT